MPNLPSERRSDYVQTICSPMDLAYIHTSFATAFSRFEKSFYALALRIYNLVYKNLQRELWYSVSQL